jgi:hypothetical protein
MMAFDHPAGFFKNPCLWHLIFDFCAAANLVYVKLIRAKKLTRSLSYRTDRENILNIEKVLFAFFIILALSLNFGFFIGETANPEYHSPYELFAALVASLICTLLKFGDRTRFGSAVLASSLVAVLQLIAATIVWAMATISSAPLDGSISASVVSLSGGALIANTVSVILLIIETSQIRK